nr:hypothetical protein CFP56_22372 [Quercus suber]
MSLQRWPGDGNQFWYPPGSEEYWNSSQYPLTVGDPQYQQNQQNHHSWQQLPRASDFKVSDIDTILGARPKRELQHASWNQDVVVPTSSQATCNSWLLEPHRKSSVAMTEPCLKPRPGGSSVTTGDSGYESFFSTSGPPNHSLPGYQQLPSLKSPEPSIRTGYHFPCPDPPQSIASEPVRNLQEDISPRKTPTRARINIPRCPDCQKEFKNNSEAK